MAVPFRYLDYSTPDGSVIVKLLLSSHLVSIMHELRNYDCNDNMTLQKAQLEHKALIWAKFHKWMYDSFCTVVRKWNCDARTLVN